MERDRVWGQLFSSELTGYNTLEQKARSREILDKIDGNWAPGDHFKIRGGIGIFKGVKKLPNNQIFMAHVEWLTMKSRKTVMSIGAFQMEAQKLEQYELDELSAAA